MYAPPPSQSLQTAFRAHSERVNAAYQFWYHLTGGAIGFCSGLVIVIPLVLWLSGPSEQAPHGKSAPVRAVAAAAVPTPPALQPRLAFAPHPAEAPYPTITKVLARQDEDKLINAAREHFRAGDLAAARRVLDQRDLSKRGDAVFLLAETYDPNVLAALGIQGVIAEPQTALRLYEAALKFGVPAARHRVEALQ